MRVAGQEIDIRGTGALPIPVRAAPALTAVLAARIAGVSVRLWHVGTGWSIPPRVLEDDFLFLPLVGALEATVDGHRGRLGPGTLAVVPVGTLHAMRFASGCRALTVVAAHLHVRDAGGAPLLAGAGTPALALADHRGWAGRLLEAAAVEPPAPALLATAGRLLLAELALRGLVLRVPAERADARLAPAFAMLHERPEAAHTIPALARACGLGVVRFRVLFHAAADCAPKAYLDRLRLARAKSLLTGGTGAVAAVAAASGFPTTRHFLARFRAATGATPTQWRRRGAVEP